MERLTRRDWTLVAICIVVFALSLFIVLNYFSRACPEASIEFRYDRKSSGVIAQRLLDAQQIDTRAMKHTAVFDSDDGAKIFLERTLGLEKANEVYKRDVHVWYWHHRWFRPLQEEEYASDIAPTGEILSYSRRIPEDRALPSPDAATSRAIAESFLARAGARTADLQLVAQSERRLPRRLQRIFTWESKSVHPAGAPYRYTVTVDGNAVGAYAQRLKVPEQWQRSYEELRSKNNLAGNIDLVFLAATLAAALVVFIVRMRRGDIAVRFLLTIGAVAVVLVTLVSLNSFPQALAGYSTTSSYPAFIAQMIAGSLLQGIGVGMLLIVICGAGEVLYREQQPRELAIPKLWNPRALASRRVFRSFILGYTLVAFFLAYQVVFYIVAGRFGAWSPADVPYDDMLNTALPWVAVLFAGFFPALSEEFLSRAFSIPFLDRVLRNRFAAIVVAGFIWGFGHATYPNQPFYIRGVEVGLAGVLIGFLYTKFGLLPLLIWHYTVDAVYTALLLFRSHNAYYIVSAGVASLIFAIPMLISIALYIRNRGFLPDDELTNATMPVTAPPEVAAHEPEAVLPPAMPVTRGRVMAAGIAVAVLVALIAIRTSWPDDAIDYRIDRDEAKAIATRVITTTMHQPMPQHTIAAEAEGFRSWDRGSRREDGGGPDGFDSVAATYLLRHGISMRRLVDVFEKRVEAATWTVRFFTPMQREEYFVEVDPRTARPIGYHKYQSEKNPGPRLEQAQALAIARTAFATFGEDVSAFDVREALSFQQPNRRDWLFHFEEKVPVAAEAFQRTTVRVAGSEVTQFATTIKIPEAVYREEGEETVLNVLFTILRIAGTLAALALVVSGFVLATRKGSLRWRWALRWTAVLAIIPIVTSFAGLESAQFGYATSIAWSTFQADLAVSLVRSIAVKIVGIFLALAAIDTVVPFARRAFSAEARARFGRSAIVSAVAAIAIIGTARAIVAQISAAAPRFATLRGFQVPQTVALAFPAVIDIAQALYITLIASGALAMAAVAIGSFPKKRGFATAIVIAILFCASLEPSVTLPETPLMLFRAILLAAALWVAGRYVLNGNALAWPLAIFLGELVPSALFLLQNHRLDLRANGIAELIVVTLVITALAAPSPRVRGEGGQRPDEGLPQEPSPGLRPPSPAARERALTSAG